MRIQYKLDATWNRRPLSLICGVEVCLCSADRQEIQESILFQIMLMPHCKNLEIFTGSEGGDVATNNAWDSFQPYCYLENSQRLVNTSATTPSLVCQLCCTWALKIDLAC